MEEENGNEVNDNVKKVDQIKAKEGEFTDQLGKQIKTYKWTPEGDIKALVFLCHGYAERLTPYYSGVAGAGAGSGLLCFGHDHTGHGHSGGERVQVRSVDEYVDPVILHCQQMSSSYPNIPLYILGHSMGGLISILATLKTQDAGLFKGLVLMGPLLELDPAVASPFLQTLARMASKIWPGLAMGGIDSKTVTSDEDWIETKKNDELHYHGGLKARHGAVLLSVLKGLEEKFVEIKCPYLLLHGAEDKVCNPSGSKKLHSLSPSLDKTLNIVEGGLHNLFIESDPIKSNAINSAINWIVERV